MIFDVLPARTAELAHDVRRWLVDHVASQTGPVFDPLPTEEIDAFGLVLSRHFGLARPSACIVHRDLVVVPHVDSLMPYPCVNLAVFWRSIGVKGGALFFPDSGEEYPATNGTAAVFDGQLRHGVRPFVVAKGQYRMTLTYYCPVED